VRYADDWLLGFAGPRSEAEDIKRQVGAFLKDTLKLELSDTKTLITHAQSGAARFLNYDVHVLRDNTARTASGRRRINGVIGLSVPADVLRGKCAPYTRHGKPIHRAGLLQNSACSIVEQYQAEYRGVVEYYRMASNVHRFNRLKWVMEQSLTKTLAGKLKLSVPQVYDRYGTTLKTPNGPYKGLQVTVERPGKDPLVATWGGIALKRNLDVTLNDQPPRIYGRRTELEQRLLAGECELCGSTRHVEVHHVRGLKDLRKRGRPEKPAWVQVMAERRRKTLVVCQACHAAIHAGRPTRQGTRNESLESRVR
jgi:hypothetical protein